MDKKDIILIILAVPGWIWAIFQFIINRINQKKDKLIDRKYDAYSAYMKKTDEINNNLRKDPNMVLNSFLVLQIIFYY